ncbi:glycoside hydrolase 43 family protein [Mucilaginibacter sp. X5P1]|uniref:glycoside hydrolase family 43 protein n=1 Tax=Mucilaginibacter sp. X5P1 TaxID=2723088 RepID=UPI001617AB18|nr:glycoside hydrolase 43 family protein [Mucilaginibacter sp. X5P1]MBB6138297.1 beta-xylosidase [Mucilaginibacter sp. X5P1]
MKKLITYCLLVSAATVNLFFVSAAYCQIKPSTPYKSNVWVADNGDGTYKNPVLYADYSDPDVIRVGDNYYLTASSFNCMPGLPILRSKDLINWILINYALRNQAPDSVYAKPQHGKGVWAPAIRYHNGFYYIYYPDPDYGVYMIKTRNIAGDWEKPVLVLKAKGVIDPCPLWDDNGKAYLISAWAASRAGVNSLLTIYPLNSEGTSVTGEGKHVFDGHDNQKTVEGPKLYKRNGYYYIFAPAGGVQLGWQLVLRSKDIYGPYEQRIVMDQGSTAINGPHQGAWVETPAGESWFLHFQDKGAYGRILHLEPVKWVSDWPVIGIVKNGNGKGEPVSTYKKPDVGRTYPINTPVESDEFNTDTLGLQWQWQANYKINWYALMRGSCYLRLFAYPQPKGAINLWEIPNLLLQKFPAPDFTATTKVKYTVEANTWQQKKAGLIISGNDYAYLSISKNDKSFIIQQVICKDAAAQSPEEVVEEKSLSGSLVYLKVSISAPGAICNFSYSENGIDFIPIGKPFIAKQDLWTGSKVGIFCTAPPTGITGGYADFDWFRIDNK